MFVAQLVLLHLLMLFPMDAIASTDAVASTDAAQHFQVCHHEFAIGQIDLFWNFDQSRFELPPPFNLIAIILAAPPAVICSEPPHHWRCTYCLGSNRRASEPGKAVKVMVTCQV
jgi:hypothetical protein